MALRNLSTQGVYKLSKEMDVSKILWDKREEKIFETMTTRPTTVYVMAKIVT